MPSETTCDCTPIFTSRPDVQFQEREGWEPCAPRCEGWHVFEASRSCCERLEIEACDEAGRFKDQSGVSRDDWAVAFVFDRYGLTEAEVAEREERGESVDPSSHNRKKE